MRALLLAVLARLTDRPLADAILGDLEELRSRDHHRPRALRALRFWRAAFAILAHAGGARIRDRWRQPRTTGFGRDLRGAVGGLRRSPAFTVSAILLLALGIGANTAVFSVVRAVLLRPLPYHEPDRLVYVWPVRTTDPALHRPLTGLQVGALRDARSLASFAVLRSWVGGVDSRMDLVHADGAERLRGTFATPNLFEVLGVQARLGRTFVTADAEAEALVVISDGLWRRRFGGDAQVVGRQVPLASGAGLQRRVRTYTVVGVLPPAFRLTYPEETEIFAMLPWREIEPTRAVLYDLIARLAPGVSPEAAAAELTPRAQDLVRGYDNIPEAMREQAALSNRIVTETAPQHVEHEARRGVLLLAAVAALVLLIACVNLALLVLARTVDRTRELALRAALGAGTFRLARQLLAEGMVLGSAGGAAGLAIAFAGLPLLRSLLPPLLPRGDETRVDLQVLGAAFAMTAATALVCGVTPLWQAVRCDLQTALRRLGGTTTGDRGVARSRRVVVAVQMATVFVLLTGAGLLLHSFWRMQQVDLGFDGRSVVVMEMQLLSPRYRQPGRIAQFQRELIERVRAVPGVADAALATSVPMRGVDFRSQISAHGVQVPVRRRTVDGAYFRVMNIPLRAGRLFDERDGPTAPRVVILSEAAARRAFGTPHAVGSLLSGGQEVIGVVGDVRHADVLTEPEPAAYLARSQEASQVITLLARPAHPGVEIVPSIRRELHALDPEQPVERISTVDQVVGATTAERRFYAVATSVFAAVALALALAGLVGVVGRTVTERRRDIAIRLALGADAARVRGGVVRSALFPVAAGAVAGLAGAIAAARLLRTLLFGISPYDPVAFGVAAGFLIGAAALACYVPARRATAVEPMSVLRGD